MGRPALRKSGAYTGAERQRRYRRKRARAEYDAKAAKWAAQLEEQQQRDFAEQRAAVAYYRELERKRRGRDFLILKPLPENIERLAEELVNQLLQAMRDFPGVTIDDVRAAIDRRTG